MTVRLHAVVLAAAIALSGATFAADDATPAQLAAQAREILDQRSPDFDKAKAAIDEALQKSPHYPPAAVQRARLTIMLGGESEESLRDADNILVSLPAYDNNYGPSYVMRGYVLMKLGRNAEASQAFFRASRVSPDDPAYLYYNAMFIRETGGDAMPFYERYLASGDRNDGQRFEAARYLLTRYTGLGNREKADGAFAELVRIAPNSAELYGDHARDVMITLVDFDQGEKLARKALSLRNYAHARQSLSLALYGKWADAKRRGASAAEVASLYAAARAYDPGARLVPSCALEAPSLRFVADSVAKIRDRNTASYNC